MPALQKKTGFYKNLVSKRYNDGLEGLNLDWPILGLIWEKRRRAN